MNHLKIAFIILLLLTTTSFASTTGKISGKVTDKETGTPLPGVNIIIEKTSIGTASDFDGNYSLLNISPGSYNLRFSMMGYADVFVKNAKVEIDLTTNIDVQLSISSISSEEVIIVAERPIVARDVSNSQMNITGKSIEALPVTTVEQVISLQAGVQQGSSGIVVRGGSANQTVFMVDGFSQNDERANLPYTTVSLSSVKEIKVQTGGFNAEYGNIRSGLINVVTKEGSKSKYSATINFKIAPATSKHFGNSIYDPYSYFNRPYNDPDVMWEGTNSGAWSSFMQNQYPQFEGWNSVSENTLDNADESKHITAAGAKQLYDWQHRRTGDIEKPDYTIDLGFGGPVPFIGKQLGSLRFFFSYFNTTEMFVFPLSRDAYKEDYGQIKFVSDISSSLKLTINGMYGEINSVSSYNWDIPNGQVLRSTSGIANLVNIENLNMPGYYSPTDIFRSSFGAKLSHVISAETYYEVKIQHKRSEYKTFELPGRDTSKIYEIVSGYFVDEAPYGYWGSSVSGVDGMSLGGWMNLGRDQSVNSTTTLQFDYTSQINSSNMIKAGFEAVYNNYDINAGTYSPSMTTWTRSQIYKLTPFRISAYAQDKLEYEEFVMNVGLRADYSAPNSEWYQLTDYDKYLQAGYGNSIEDDTPTEKVSGKLYLSPRLGISHPITTNSKLYFNYGHFMSEPSSTYRFRLQRESNGMVKYLGNPFMEPEKTIAYELGYSQSIVDLFLLNVAAYYKDVTNQPGWILYENTTSTVSSYTSANNNYADIRGFEVTLSKNRGDWVRGFINYTYDVRTSGYFGYTKYYEDPEAQRKYLALNPNQSKPQPQPFARLNVEFSTPYDYGKEYGGIHPLGSWSFTVLADWKSGSYSTFNPNSLPGIIDNVQWRDWFNIDIRLSKTIIMEGFNMQFYLDVSNVLNLKHLSSAGFSDSYDEHDYKESLHFDWEEGAEKGNDKLGDYRAPGVEYVSIKSVPDINQVVQPDAESLYYDSNSKRYYKYGDDSWQKADQTFLDNTINNKAYIDNPNIQAFTFLNPRIITLGIKIDF
jgi:outer membrane receptor protein involved in Fe transport